jgi:hypothetical protein
MYSWKLFKYVIVAWNAEENPVFLREIQHYPVWYGFAQRIALWASVRAGIVMLGFLMWVIIVLYFNNLLFFLVPPLLFFISATGFTLAPIVAQERVQKSWEPLLTIPPTLDLILLGKVGGALWWTRRLMLMMGVIMLTLSIGAGFVSLILIPTGFVRNSDWGEFFLCGGIIVFPIVGSAIFLIDRIQQYLLLVTVVLVGVTATASIRRALSMASAAVLLVWLVEVVVTGVLMALQPGHQALLDGGRILSYATLGPVISYIMELSLSQAVLYIAGTLCVREFLIRCAWRWSVRQARL